MERTEVWDYESLGETGDLPYMIQTIAYMSDNGALISHKHGVVIGQIDDILKYEADAESRVIFYGRLDPELKSEEMYQMWVDHMITQQHEGYEGYQELGY